MAVKDNKSTFSVVTIPEQLKQIDRWAPWRLVLNTKRSAKAGRDVFDKVPHRADNPNFGISTGKPDQWFSFDAAVRAVERNPDKFEGVGFCITGQSDLVMVDLDDCVVDGDIAPWADEVVVALDSYTEFSPSGQGLRIVVQGSVPFDWTNHDVGIEVYAGHQNRFLTITGDHLLGSPATVARPAADVLADLASRYARERKTAEIIDLAMPDLLDELMLPDPTALPISDAARAFLEYGAAGDDRSGTLHATGVALYAAGLDDAVVFSTLVCNEHAMEVALDHRRQDSDRAMLYLWREHCVKARPKARALVASPDEFDNVMPTERERNQQQEQARDALDAKRREHQKRENEKIGEGAYRIPIAEKITLESALERFVFLSEGSLVADVFNPHFVLKLPDWKNTYAASTKELPGAPGKPPKVVPVSLLWHTSERRKTATTRTFKADGGLMVVDPDGKLAVNSWRPFDRSMHVADPRTAGVGLFFEHVAFLFGDDAPRFLDWLAHIEQQPGVLPHTSWLHIASHFGTGRNWLASVLTRVWAGSVAANLDLMQMFKSNFNGQLSRKVLAVVDEIREGGRDSQWEHSEKLKKTITEETRYINPKYGHTSTEFNACRWLLFSNHLSAIPLENGDRRIEVVSTEAQPQGPEYYTRLYQALESREFIAAVATVLRERDISAFNPGAHAHNTGAKKAATNASRTPMAEACQLLVDHWPSDFITASDLINVLAGGRADGALTAAHRRTLEQAGVKPFGRAVKIDGKPTRVSVVRNTAHWLQHGTADDVRKNLEHVKIDVFEDTAYEFLLGLVAE